MKRRATSRSSISLLALACAAGAVSCKSEDLEPLQLAEVAATDYVRVESNFCLEPRATSKQKVKYLFVLDHSGSNQPGFGGVNDADVSNTDPNGYRRYGLLQFFVQQLISNSDPNNQTSFALIDFNDFAYQPTARMTGGRPPVPAPNSRIVPLPFNTDAQDFLTNYLAFDWIGGGGDGAPGNSPPAPYDAGFTNYSKALQFIHTVIKSDAQNEAASVARPIVASSYQIIFVSDGLPVVPAGSTTVQQGLAPNLPSGGFDLSNDIDKIVSLRADAVVGPFISAIALNTVYYSVLSSVLTPAQVARQDQSKQLLAQMAQIGGGQAQAIGSGQQVNYQMFAPPIRNLKYLLTDAFVENLNAAWWDDGKLMLDSDADGLPDLIEGKLNSNPFSTDSDGNGVSDLVEYRTKGAPCKDLRCAIDGRDLYGICSGFNPAVAADGTVTFASTANDGLNDCEKFVIGANRAFFDSNGDFIPDLMALKSLLAVIPGTNTTFLNPFGDERDNYRKIKTGYPVSVSEAKIQNFKARVTNLVHVDSDSPDFECYDFTVDPVVLTGGGNTIKVSVIENAALLDDKPILRSAVRTLSGNERGRTVEFHPSDFK